MKIACPNPDVYKVQRIRISHLFHIWGVVLFGGWAPPLGLGVGVLVMGNSLSVLRWSDIVDATQRLSHLESISHFFLTVLALAMNTGPLRRYDV